MKDLIIYGAGGLGREIAVLIGQINQEKKQFKILGFFDDGLKKGTEVDDLEVLGGIHELNEFKKPVHLAISIADPKLRAKVVAQIKNSRVVHATLIHPSCNLGARARNDFGVGCIITAGVVMTTHIKLHNFVIVNLSTTIGHDVSMGDCTSVMPSCSISGNVKIGKRVFIGTGARILQNLSLGDDCVVGAGAVVTKNFISGSKVMGVPATRS